MFLPLCQAAALPTGQSRGLIQRFQLSSVLETKLHECSGTAEAATVARGRE